MYLYASNQCPTEINMPSHMQSQPLSEPQLQQNDQSSQLNRPSKLKTSQQKRMQENATCCCVNSPSATNNSSC